MDEQLRAEIERIVRDELMANQEIYMGGFDDRSDRNAIGQTAYFAIKSALEGDLNGLGEIIGNSSFPPQLVATELALMCAHTIRRSSTRARRLADLRHLAGLD